jgi:UDP-N-acetylglucosamine transferase subunit ALG13
MINIFLQLPKFIMTIRQEHNEVSKIVNEKKIDLLISDCRYGCWSDLVSSIFITHQVNLLMPPALKWIGPLINFFNRLQIKKFTRCWVPDFPENRITEKLSESKDLTIDYIGMLSRFNPSIGIDRPKKYEMLAVLSGPEPQRSKFEDILKNQLLLCGKSCLLVRGLPRGEAKREVNAQMEIVNYLSSNELQAAIEDSGIIISRSGYSSIMDFTRLGGHFIFVPTPGQTEQEYLAKQLETKGIAFYQRQEEFDLNFALTNSVRYKGFNNQDFSSSLLNKAIDDLLK